MRWLLVALFALMLVGCRATPARSPSSIAGPGQVENGPEKAAVRQAPIPAASGVPEAPTTPNAGLEQSSNRGPERRGLDSDAAALPVAAFNEGPAPGAEPQEAPAAQPRSTASGERGRALPRLSLKVVGLHVGGGPNDASTKSTFAAPLLHRSAVLMACYRHVDVPRQYVLFGADLLIPKDGGRGRVQQMRTKVASARFSDCLRRELERVPFTSPLGRATIVSYSLRFSLDGLPGASPPRRKQTR